MGYEWLALAAAFLWAIASLLSVTPARHLGTFAYSRWRMGSTFTILATMALYRWLVNGRSISRSPNDVIGTYRHIHR